MYVLLVILRILSFLGDFIFPERQLVPVVSGSQRPIQGRDFQDRCFNMPSLAWWVVSSGIRRQHLTSQRLLHRDPWFLSRPRLPDLVRRRGHESGPPRAFIGCLAEHRKPAEIESCFYRDYRLVGDAPDLG